ISARAQLRSFGSCEELEQYVEDTAVNSMRVSLTQAKAGVYGGGFRGEVATADAPAAEAAGAADNAAPSSYTTTNTQVAGVDEADFVKNDGTRAFVLSANRLYLNQSWPAAELKTVSSLAIEGYPREMFLDDKNHVVVFSNVYSRYAISAYAADLACASLECGYSYSNSTKVTVIDVSDMAAPKITQEYYLPGGYASSRRIGSSVRVVLADSFNYPRDTKWYPDYSPGLYDDEARLAAEYDKLIVANEKIIRAQTLDGWLPQAQRTLAAGTKQDSAYDCSRFLHPTTPSHLGIVTVATLNLENAATLNQTSLIAESGEVYASSSSLYVANQHWWWWPELGQSDFTYIHKFDISQPDDAVYVASGGVDGHIVDQFSLDEHNGFLRVASTINTRVKDEVNTSNVWGTLKQVSRVTVLKESSNFLEVAGQTEDFAPDERIYSSRFLGDRGYVVTFRQVDPFFTFDLSDPTAPKKVGELKIPGFSTYLHPVDATHILAVGSYVPEDNTDWMRRSLKVSLFDVSDFANPKEQSSLLVGTAYSHSEALYDHKAFNYFPEKKLLAIPFTDWSPNRVSGSAYWSSFTSELRVFSVDTTAGITARGALSMKDLYQAESYNEWVWYWVPAVRRSIMADDFVYAISDAGIRVANIANLAAPVATTRFNRYLPTK
ncbi:MAG: beta-propeller domain-containing protein, partial [Myxococcaceae bacterium]